ncbi:MAG: hypothetical protein ACKOCN_02695 [Planctomycetaceae bacterium]
MDSLMLVMVVAVAGVCAVGGLLFMQSQSDRSARSDQNHPQTQRVREVAAIDPVQRMDREAARRPSEEEGNSSPSRASSRSVSVEASANGPSALDSLPDGGLKPPAKLPDPPAPGRGPPPRSRDTGPRSKAPAMEDAAMEETSDDEAAMKGEADGQKGEPETSAAPPNRGQTDASMREPAMANEAAPKPAPDGGTGDGDGEAGPIIDAAVDSVFASLVESDFEAANAALEPAVKAKKDRDEAERVEGWKLLIEYAEGFDRYRRQAVASVKSGNEYVIPKRSGDGEMRVGIIDVANGVISFRVNGKSIEKSLDRMPSNLLMAIMKDWFDDNPANNLYLGAYHITRPEPDLKEAERLWSNAALRGADAAPLLPLVREDVILKAAAGE